MEGLKAIEFVEDIMNAQNNYIAIRESGFFHKSKEIRILDPIMQKYGMTYDEAYNAARGRLTMQEYFRILLRKMETDGIHNT